MYDKELDIFLTVKVFENTPSDYRSESFAMNTDTHTSGSTVKNHISLKTRFGNSATRRISFPIVVLGLSTSSSSGSSSTSRTPSRQESHRPTSSSSSSTSPTTTSSGSETPDREDPSGIDSHPVLVSSSHVERIERRDLFVCCQSWWPCQATHKSKPK